VDWYYFAMVVYFYSGHWWIFTPALTAGIPKSFSGRFFIPKPCYLNVLLDAFANIISKANLKLSACMFE